MLKCCLHAVHGPLWHGMARSDTIQGTQGPGVIKSAVCLHLCLALIINSACLPACLPKSRGTSTGCYSCLFRPAVFCLSSTSFKFPAQA